MLRKKTLGSVVLLGLLGAGAAQADGYRSEPQIRLGLDILWGGYGGGYGGGYYAPPAPVVVYPPYYGPPRGPGRGYGRGYARGYERGYDRGYDKGHRHTKWRGKRHDDHRQHYDGGHHHDH